MVEQSLVKGGVNLVYFCSAEVVQIYSALDTPMTKPFEQTNWYHPNKITRREEPSTELKHSSLREFFRSERIENMVRLAS